MEVFALSDGVPTALKKIVCKDESRELQDALERNLNLLPGDQIEPDDPRRWLLVKREMPVPDPVSATDRWSLDFLLADHEAVPTLVS